MPLKKISGMGKQSSEVKNLFVAFSGSSQTLIDVLINLLSLLMVVAFFFLESLPRGEYSLGQAGLNLGATLDTSYLQCSTADLKEIGCFPGYAVHPFPCSMGMSGLFWLAWGPMLYFVPSVTLGFFFFYI